jgi:peptide/nickel transport system substrate-binding protein
MVLSGCSNSAQEQTAANEPVNSPPSQSSDAEPAAPVFADATIVLGGYRDPGRGIADPYFTNINLYVWEPLIALSDDGEPTPCLATKWEMSEDAKVWTFSLRKGVSFSDGVPFNADAVLANFDRYTKLGVASSTFFSFNAEALYPGLQSVEKIDDYTVSLTFDTPIPMLPYLVVNWGCGMFSPECYNPDTGEFKEFCVGTGPFIIAAHKPEESLILERNANYYGEPAKAKSIEIRVIPDHETRMAALRAGEIQGVYDNNAIQPLSAKELVDTGNFTASAALSANIHYMGVNTSNYPFSDVRMRQALSMMIDRQVMVDQIYQGYGKPIAHLLSPLSGFYEDIPVTYDPAAAKAVAAEVLQGQSPVIRFYSISNYKTDAELIASYMTELGLTPQLEILESAALTEAQKSGNYDIVMAFKGMNNYDPRTMLYSWMATGGDMNKSYGTYYSNPDVDALFDKLDGIYDLAERGKIYKQLQEICAEELPCIPLYAVTTLVVSSNDITGYNARFTGVTLADVRWAS